MNTRRTTITFREDVYEQLMRLVVSKRMTLSEVVNARLSGRDWDLVGGDMALRIKRSRDVLGKLATKAKRGVDVVAEVRKMRQLA